MEQTTEVTEVQTRTIQEGLSVEITVVRHAGLYSMVKPRPVDVPADVRAALLEWLGA